MPSTPPAISTYPAKSCDIDRLVRQSKAVDAAIAGRKTQQRRDGLYAYPGETFELSGVAFTITGVDRQRLGDMTDADAQAEGYADMQAYRDVILRMHPGMAWDGHGCVWVHRFERRAAPAPDGTGEA